LRSIDGRCAVYTAAPASCPQFLVEGMLRNLIALAFALVAVAVSAQRDLQAASFSAEVASKPTFVKARALPHERES